MVWSTIEWVIHRLSGHSTKAPIDFNEDGQIVISHNLVTARISSVQQGTCHGGLPATLVVFDFVIAALEKRLEKVTVKVGVEASSLGDGNLAATQPEVERFCPGILNGEGSETAIQETIRTGFIKRRTTVTEYRRRYHSTIAGQKWRVDSSSKERRHGGAADHEEVEWTLNENDSLQLGLRPVFKAAVLIKHTNAVDCPFLATITVIPVTKTKLSARMLSRLRPEAQCVKFPSSLHQPRENPPQVLNFDDWGEEDWKRLIDFDKIFAVSLRQLLRFAGKGHRNHSKISAGPYSGATSWVTSALFRIIRQLCS
jgi:hypothetical protein